MTPHGFVKTPEGLGFNPYPELLRWARLCRVDSLRVGGCSGYLGGSETGSVITDDAHLDKHSGRWDISVEKPIKDVAKEGTELSYGMPFTRLAPRFFPGTFSLYLHMGLRNRLRTESAAPVKKSRERNCFAN